MFSSDFLHSNHLIFTLLMSIWVLTLILNQVKMKVINHHLLEFSILKIFWQDFTIFFTIKWVLSLKIIAELMSMGSVILFVLKDSMLCYCCFGFFCQMLFKESSDIFSFSHLFFAVTLIQTLRFVHAFILILILVTTCCCELIFYFH